MVTKINVIKSRGVMTAATFEEQSEECAFSVQADFSQFGETKIQRNWDLQVFFEKTTEIDQEFEKNT